MFNIVTHHRQFHNDEVMAIALLEIFFLKEKYKLIRTRDKEVIKKHQSSKNSFVIDVGFKYDESNLNFDHHQNDKRLVWDDKTPYSSCGLIWKFLKDNNYLQNKIPNRKVAFLEEFIIKEIDRQDNGVGQWKDGVFISMHNRNHHDDKIMDLQFKRALSSGKDYLINIISAHETKKHDFSYSAAGFVTLINQYLGHIDYKLTFVNKKVGITFVENENIKEIELFKEAVDKFDLSLLWGYLVKSNTLNQKMNNDVAKKMKESLIDKAKANNKNIAFISLCQYNIENDFVSS